MLLPWPAHRAGSSISPEVDDEVLVAFEHGDFDHPFVVGFFWNGVDQPPESDRKKRSHRDRVRRPPYHRSTIRPGGRAASKIKSSSGQTVTIDDAQQSIELHGGGRILALKGGQVQITLMPRIMTTNGYRSSALMAALARAFPRCRSGASKAASRCREGDTGSSDLSVPPPVRRLRSPVDEAQRHDASAESDAILETDFNQTFTGLPLPITEHHHAIDNSTPAPVPNGGEAPPLESRTARHRGANRRSRYRRLLAFVIATAAPEHLRSHSPCPAAFPAAVDSHARQRAAQLATHADLDER